MPMMTSLVPMMSSWVCTDDDVITHQPAERCLLRPSVSEGCRYVGARLLTALVSSWECARAAVPDVHALKQTPRPLLACAVALRHSLCAPPASPQDVSFAVQRQSTVQYSAAIQLETCLPLAQAQSSACKARALPTLSTRPPNRRKQLPGARAVAAKRAPRARC